MSDAYPDYIEEFSIEIADFNPIGLTAHIPLPETMPKHNNGIINIQNNDDWCFGWCVLGALHPVKVHPERNPYQLYGILWRSLIWKTSQFQYQSQHQFIKSSKKIILKSVYVSMNGITRMSVLNFAMFQKEEGMNISK